MERLQREINYWFEDLGLLRQALTHRSVGGVNNERLEFLGDSVLGMVVAGALYRRFPGVGEGKLSRFKSFVVRGETLGEIAKVIGVGECLILGAGELRSGGHNRRSIQADAVEAILGAVYLEGGFVVVEKVIIGLFGGYLAGINPKDSLKDFKTRLQERVQKVGGVLPVYELIRTTGRNHSAVFVVRGGLVDRGVWVEQSAGSIKRAEQMCAEILLEGV